MKNVVVLTPTVGNRAYFHEWAKWIKRLSPEPRKVIFYIDENDYGTWKRLAKWKFPHEIIRTPLTTKNTKRLRYNRIAEIRQILLNRAKELDPDYAWFVDDDMFIKDQKALEKLTYWDVDIIGGLYPRIFPFGIRLASKWFHPNYPKPMWKMYENVPVRGLDEVAMTSGGCLLLSRKVIQDDRLHFYPMEFTCASEDFGFCLLAREYGYKIWVDGRVGLAHFISGKRKDWTQRPDKGFNMKEIIKAHLK